MCVTTTRVTGADPRACENAVSQASMVWADFSPVSTIDQPAPSAMAHTLIHGSAAHNGMRSHNTPGAIMTAEPSPVRGSDSGGLIIGNESFQSTDALERRRMRIEERRMNAIGSERRGVVAK